MAPASSALAYAVAALVCAGAGAYQQPLARPSASPRAALARQPALLPSMAASALEQSDASAAALEPVKPRTNALKTALIGSTFWLAAGLVLTVLFPLACLCWVHGKLFDKKRFRFNDYIVQIWARITMTLFRAEVTVENAELLPPADEAVMYTPNHLAFLDVYSLSGYMPRRFKYISKVENLRLPIIGWAMSMAQHITLGRADRASQVKTLKDAIESLSNGNSLVVFPEGTRSRDGRIASFKKGAFTMAGRAGRRVVPITIIGTHLYQPPGLGGLVVAIPRGVRIVVHPPLDPPNGGKEEQAVMDKAREAVMSALPPSMMPAAD